LVFWLSQQSKRDVAKLSLVVTKGKNMETIKIELLDEGAFIRCLVNNKLQSQATFAFLPDGTVNYFVESHKADCEIVFTVSEDGKLLFTKSSLPNPRSFERVARVLWKYVESYFLTHYH
jgi:hypothetical protein